MSNDPIVIVSAVRTPLGRFQGDLAPQSAPALGAHVIKAALERAKLEPERVDEALMGCVLPAGLGQAPARQAARFAGLPDATGATTVNKVCGSGMKATMLGHDLIKAGSADIVVTGGMESMSNAPYLLAKARSGYRVGHDRLLDHMMLDGLEDSYEGGRPMGDFGEATAQAYQFTRQQQDAYAVETLTRARKGAELKAHTTHSQDPAWFTTAPIPAIRKLLEKVDWTVSDVDLFEINEAFAAVAMAAQRDLGIPRDRLNVHGGACALGHPIGATGARLIVTLLHALAHHGGKRGVAALCIGGGEATAVAIERPD